MHAINRGPCPGCLQHYHHGRDNWDDLHQKKVHVEQVRSALTQMQDSMCAYCEAVFDGDKWHIEHLIPKSRKPQHTFDWDNLFGSCNRKDTCGTFKDQGGCPYDPADLVDPCRENPDEYFFFVQDGTVQPRGELRGRSLHRAKETIRVFNLNAPALRSQRARVIDGVFGSEPDLVEVLAACNPEDRQALVDDILQIYCIGGFPTPVRHLLCA